MPSLHLSFVEFLKTGKLGPLELGLAKPDIIRIIGEPLHWTDKSYGRTQEDAHIFHYVGLLLAFEGSTLDLINITADDFNALFPITWQDEFIGAHASTEKLVQFLQNNHIAYTTEVASYFVLDPVLQTEGGVFVIARASVTMKDLENGEFESLRSERPEIQNFIIRSAPKEPSGPAKKRQSHR